MMEERNIAEEIDCYIAKKRYRLINSVILWQEGEILAENYYNGFTSESRNVMRSVMKSILSAATGIACRQGKLTDLDTPIATYLAPFREGRSPMHSMITVRHLLTMTSGIYWNGGIHYHCPMMEQLRRSKDWVSYVADCAVTDIPGMKWNYKEFDMILLAAVLEEVCGDLYDFIEQELYAPLGIHSGRWFRSPDGIYYSVADNEENEAPSNLTAREMLAIGQLYLNGGVFNGQRILTEEYIQESTKSHMEPNYGYLWWCSSDCFSAMGFGGQRITIFPEKRIVAVVQATPTPSGKAYDDMVFELVGRFLG